jgi:hypothetical protein
LNIDLSESQTAIEQLKRQLHNKSVTSRQLENAGRSLDEDPTIESRNRSRRLRSANQTLATFGSISGMKSETGSSR